MTDMLQKIRDEHESRQAATRAAYRALARAIATDDDDGQQLEPGEVLATVQAAGKTLDDLAADVERLRARFQADETRKTQPDVDAERARVDKLLAELERERSAVLAALDSRRKSLSAMQHAVFSRQRDIEQAERLLRATASPELQTRLDGLQRERAALEEGIHSARLTERDLAEKAAQPLPSVPTQYDAFQSSKLPFDERSRAEVLIDARNAILAAQRQLEAVRHDIARKEARLTAVKAELADVECEILRP